jgi:prevent-host-death family protein
MRVNVLEAKTHFSKLLAAVAAGDDVVIANRGAPIARIIKYEAPKTLRKPGAWAHIKQPPGYDDFSTVNAELWKQMEASDIFAGALEREAQLKAQANAKRARSRATVAAPTKRKK